MTDPGPSVEALTHRLAECPGEFLMDPAGKTQGCIRVDAVVSDLLRFAAGVGLPQSAANVFQLKNSKGELNRLKTILVATWLLHDPWFERKTHLSGRMFTLFSERLNPLAAVVAANDFVTDPDRREELARYCLKHLDLRPEGECELEALDRFTALDSIERLRVSEEARKAEERNRQVREAMAKKKAEEAAASYGRE